MNIVFAGTPDFAADHLKGLLAAEIEICAVVTQPDKPGKRGKKPQPSAVKQLALAHELPVIQPGKLTTDALTPLAPDLLIVVAYGQILRQPVLDLPTHGCINVHASLLPRWRGAAPIQRAIEAGDEETGICIMQMDAGLDTGPVLYRASVPITSTDTAGALASRLAKPGIAGLLAVLEQIGTDEFNPLPQPEAGTYAHKLEKQEAAIDWTQHADIIARKIRAFNPDPICFTYCEGESKPMRIKLYEATADKALAGAASATSPGEVIGVSKQGVTVQAGEGVVRLEKLQLPLGKGSILGGQDILNSRTDVIHAGVKFY